MDTFDMDIDEVPDFEIVQDDGRARVKAYDKPLKFRPAKRVYIVAEGKKEGPYRVEDTNLKDRTYTLADDGGQSVEDGKWFKEEDLEAVDK